MWGCGVRASVEVGCRSPTLGGVCWTYSAGRFATGDLLCMLRGERAAGSRLGVARSIVWALLHMVFAAAAAFGEWERSDTIVWALLHVAFAAAAYVCRSVSRVFSNGLLLSLVKGSFSHDSKSIRGV